MAERIVFDSTLHTHTHIHTRTHTHTHSVHASDMSLVMAVAAVHSTDPDISYRLNNALLQRSLRKHGN